MFSSNKITISGDTFYVGKKKIPITLKKVNKGYTVKLGSGLMSYTMETTKDELDKLSSFINNYLANN